MNNRIKILRKDALNLSQKEFADRIGLSENFVWMVEKGNRIPSDRTISDICREFNVNPKWLRDGEEPIFMPTPEDDIAYINDLLNELDNPFIETIKAILIAYNECSPQNQKILRDFARSFSSKMQKENRD